MKVIIWVFVFLFNASSVFAQQVINLYEGDAPNSKKIEALSDVIVDASFYATGGHGYGMDNPTSEVDWFEACIKWLRTNGWLEAKDAKKETAKK